MENSVLSFQNVNFLVGKKPEKLILTSVSGDVKYGHVLAIMGPSGAGKTTLISTLTLDGLYGKPTGLVTLNGVPLTDKIFKKHCYIVKQQDKHWPYLTCRETLFYAARLYRVEDAESQVDLIIKKMGLNICENTRNARLSGGQRRRLSIGIALLKQPTVLFLDEPTSGLDSASASSIMEELVRVAKEEKLIIVCTIHQPSTRVYNGFDQVMVMSRGREAFTGDVGDAVPYFSEIGHTCPPATNPAEFFLDLVNSDFSDEAVVTEILDTWDRKRPQLIRSQESAGLVKTDPCQPRGFGISYFSLVVSRHFKLIVRDPVLYVGRSVMCLISGLLFSLVYLSARNYTQDQALNKMWITLWLTSVPASLGVVAVYSLNDEFKSVLRETKNGMITGWDYFLAKFILVIPVFFIFAFFSLGIPSYVIQDAPPESLGICVILYAVTLFVFESVAEALAVWLDDPLTGMLFFMMFWFGAFLFGGFLIPKSDMYYPFEAFYFAMPFKYYLQAYMYETFSVSTFEACVDITSSAVCVNSTNGLDVLEGVGKVFPLLTAENETAQAALILLTMGLLFKFVVAVGILYKTKRVATIQASPLPTDDILGSQPDEAEVVEQTPKKKEGKPGRTALDNMEHLSFLTGDWSA